MRFIDSLQVWARRIKLDSMTLWAARTHPRTPWYAKAVVIFVVAYALSPIDLIPDFIPVLGYLDDAILLPALIWIAIRMIPFDVLNESRMKAEEWMKSSESKPRSLVGAFVIVALWMLVTVVLTLWLLGLGGRGTVNPVAPM